MMATTAASERAAIELLGTIDVEPRGARASGGTASMSSHGSAMVGAGPVPDCSVIDMQSSFMEYEAARIELVHQGDIVGRDHDGGA